MRSRAARYRTWTAAADRVRSAAVMTSGDPDPLDVLKGVADASAQAIEALKTKVPTGRIRQAVRLIGTGRTVWVAGRESAYPVAAYLADGLTRLGYRGRLLDASDAEEPLDVEKLRGRDVLVAFSFGRTCPLADCVRIARKRGVRVLAIADSRENLLAAFSDENLVLHPPAQHSVPPLAAHFVLVQSLLMALNDLRTR